MSDIDTWKFPSRVNVNDVASRLILFVTMCDLLLLSLSLPSDNVLSYTRLPKLSVIIILSPVVSKDPRTSYVFDVRKDIVFPIVVKLSVKEYGPHLKPVPISPYELPACSRAKKFEQPPDNLRTNTSLVIYVGAYSSLPCW